MKTKLEIIQETYDYYTADPNGRRAIIGKGCHYLLPDGRRCAVGRCFDRNLPDEKVMRISAGCAASWILDETTTATSYTGDLPGGFYLLSEEYNIPDIGFWVALQGFHDIPKNWDREGNKITEVGQKFFEELKEKYADTVSE